MAKKTDAAVATEPEADGAVLIETKGDARDYFERIAGWMRDNGVTNPREIPDAVVESLASR